MIVGVLCLVIEGLDAGGSAFKCAQPQAENRAAAEEFHAVGKEDRSLDGVLVGKQALKAVGDEAGQQAVLQLQRRGPGLPGERGFAEGQPLFRPEVEVGDQTVLGHREPGAVGAAGIELVCIMVSCWFWLSMVTVTGPVA